MMSLIVRRWVCFLCLLLTLVGCSVAGPRKPEQKKVVGLIEKIKTANQKLLEQNQVLEQDIAQISVESKKEKKAFDQRLVAMEKTISLMEQNLANLPARHRAQRKIQKPKRRKIVAKPALSPALKPAMRLVELPKMAPLKPSQTARIREPNNRVFLVPPSAPVKSNKRAPEVKKLVGEEKRPQEIPTPKGSLAIASVQLKPGAKSVAPRPKKPQAGFVPQATQLQAQKDEIWEDPDLEEPIAPIKLQIFPAANRKYNEAFKTYTRQDFQGAIKQFDFFLSRYPNDLEADNAQFWQGMAYFDAKEWDRAENKFRKVLRNYHHGATRRGYKTPDAVLMIAKIYLHKHKPIRARYYFAWVQKKFPKSRSASKAGRELRALRSKGSR